MPDARSAIEGNISLDNIDVHDHVALFFQTGEDKEHCLSRLVRLACQRDEACIFITRRADDELVRTIMTDAGLKCDCLSREGRIALIDLGDEVDGQEVTASLLLDIIGELIDSVLDRGFTAVRLFNDMDRLRELLPGYEHVIFESLSNELYEEKNAIGICLVNAMTSRTNVMNAIMTHPTLIVKGFACYNHFFMPPEECSRLFGNPPSMPFILDKLLEIQMSELVPSSSEEDLRTLNAKLQGEVERRQMVEWALLRSENDYRTAMNAINEMVLVTDKDNRVLIANDAFLDGLDIVGYHGKVIGEDLLLMMPFLSGNDSNDHEEIIEKGRTSLKEDTFEIDGRELTLEIRKVPIMDGDKVGRVLTVVRNITEFHKARNALTALKEEFANLAKRQAEELNTLREEFAIEQERRQLAEGRLLSVFRVLETSKVAIFVGDRERHIVYANPACSEYVGYGNLEIMNVNFMDLFIPEERKMIEEVTKGLKDRNEVAFFARARRRDGSYRPCAINLIKIDDVEGFTLAIMTDGDKVNHWSGSISAI